jgi:hypothetical protein
MTQWARATTASWSTMWAFRVEPMSVAQRLRFQHFSVAVPAPAVTRTHGAPWGSWATTGLASTWVLFITLFVSRKPVQ